MYISSRELLELKSERRRFYSRDINSRQRPGARERI